MSKTNFQHFYGLHVMASPPHKEEDDRVYTSYAKMRNAATKMQINDPLFGKFVTRAEAEHFSAHGVRCKSGNTRTSHVFVASMEEHHPATSSAVQSTTDAAAALALIACANRRASSFQKISAARSSTKRSSAIFEVVLCALAELITQNNPPISIADPVLFHLDDWHAYNCLNRWMDKWAKNDWRRRSDGEVVDDAEFLSGIHTFRDKLGGSKSIGFVCHAKSKALPLIRGMCQAKDMLLIPREEFIH